MVAERDVIRSQRFETGLATDTSVIAASDTPYSSRVGSNDGVKMSGTLPLHSAVTMPCACCLLPTSFTFSSASDQAVCSHCVNHLSRAERREADHLARWTAALTAHRSEYLSLQERTDREAAAQRGEIAELAASVAHLTKIIVEPDAAAPPLPTRALLQTALITAAETKRDRALKYRDIAMAALFKLAELHESVGTGTAADLCRCGKRASSCTDLAVLDGVRGALLSWKASH